MDQIVQEPADHPEVLEPAVDDLDERSEVVSLKYQITAYGADYPVDGLVKRLNDGDIVIPTFDPEVEGEGGVEGFQRGFVWTRPQMDRFVESLLLGLPVPGIFLVKQPSGKLLVLDGQQRLRTLQSFYAGVVRGREFRLEYVQDPYNGKRYQDLDVEDRRRLDDSIIHATIIRQEEPSDDQSSVYQIFERLNTGGTDLQPQEIRVALYRGTFVRLLRELNEDNAWRTLYGARSKALKDQEMILRFFAMLERGDVYTRPMKEFLNSYMGVHRNIPEEPAQRFAETFRNAVGLALRSLGARAFRLKVAVNAAVVDSVLVGLAKRLKSGPLHDEAGVREAYERLLAIPEYLAAVERATADDESVRTRLRLATEAFAEVA